MPWPKFEHIHCIGFDKKYLPALKIALDFKVVVWGRSNGFCEGFTTYFSWAGCEWSVDEYSEIITGFRLISGEIEPETLTAAMLGAKIET